MRTAFFLVLLANLTLLMYEYHRGAFEQTAAAPAPDAALLREPIVLAGELKADLDSARETALGATHPEQGDTQKAEAATQPPVPQNHFVCYEAGPFANEQALKTWSTAVGAVDGEAKPVLRDGQQILGYLVLYPTAGSQEAMTAALQTLRHQGLTDALPLTTGLYKGYISLGVFRRESRAMRMQQDLQGRDIAAVVKPRFKDGGQTYALFTGPDAITGRLGELGQRYPNILLRALPDTAPGCLERRSGASAQKTAEAVESPANPLQAPPQAAAAVGYAMPEPGPETPAGGLVSSENKRLQAEPVIEKTPAQAEQETPSPTDDGEAVNRVCYEAGPFPNEQSLSAWQKQVAGFQGRIKAVFRDGKVIGDYLVLYRASGSAEASKADLRMLHERGLNDVWLLPTGEEKGQIALGVFNREENALQMQKNLLGQGIDSVVRPRYKSQRQKYALIAGAESITGSLQALEMRHPAIKLRKLPDSDQDCPKEITGMH